MFKSYFIVILITLTIWSYSFSQEAKVPDDFSSITEEQCRNYERNILKLIAWLSENSMETDKKIRMQSLLFIKKWGAECPTILLCPYTKISNPIFRDLRNKNKRKRYGVELYMSYLNGMIKCILHDSKSTDLVKIQQSGIESLIAFYKKNSEMVYDAKSVKIYMALQQSGELKSWIEKRISKKLQKRYEEFIKGNLKKEDIGFRDYQFN